MKKISKLILRDHIDQADILTKKAQKSILGGYDESVCTLSCSGGYCYSPYASCASLTKTCCSDGGYCSGNCSDL